MRWNGFICISHAGLDLGWLMLCCEKEKGLSKRQYMRMEGTEGIGAQSQGSWEDVQCEQALNDYRRPGQWCLIGSW